MSDKRYDGTNSNKITSSSIIEQRWSDRMVQVTKRDWLETSKSKWSWFGMTSYEQKQYVQLT